MSVSLQKGQKISLTKGNEGLSKVIIGLGWDEAAKSKGGLLGGLFGSSGPAIDCDASAFVLQNGKLADKKDIVYFGNLKHYTGTVKSMTSYGVFVDIGGVDGMVHISELSWSRIKNPAEVVSVGDTLDVYVISFDPEKKKISLGVKDHSIDPWQVFMDKYQVGDVASVRIVKLMTFGAFAEVVPGVDGLIHISQIADRRIDKPEDVLSEGQIVDAKITAIDEEKQKISLSIRALLTPAADEAEEEEAPVEE